MGFNSTLTNFEEKNVGELISKVQNEEKELGAEEMIKQALKELR